MLEYLGHAAILGGGGGGGGGFGSPPIGVNFNYFPFGARTVELPDTLCFGASGTDFRRAVAARMIVFCALWSPCARGCGLPMPCHVIDLAYHS